jgi:hypothetical protein
MQILSTNGTPYYFDDPTYVRQTPLPGGGCDCRVIVLQGAAAASHMPVGIYPTSENMSGNRESSFPALGAVE